MANVFLACCMPTIAVAQSLTLNAASASGDCSGTSFHQSSGPPGRYLAAEWAVTDQFAAPINRGRIRCTIRYTVTVPTGHRLVPGGMSGNVNRVALAQLPSLRLNGAATGVLVESSLTIDAGAPAVYAGVSNGVLMTSASLLVERPAGSPPFEGVCATASKSSFQLVAVVDLAAASNYVSPWPPEPYVERERAPMGGFRLFYTVVPCATGRAAVPSEMTARP